MIPHKQLSLADIFQTARIISCGFSKAPDTSKITRFKQDILDDLQLVFNHLVDLTNSIKSMAY